MLTKTYIGGDFGFTGTNYKGEEVVAVQELNGKIYIFTAFHVYVARKLRWYERAWRWIKPVASEEWKESTDGTR